MPTLNIPHISPVGAYDSAAGRVTMLDVDPEQKNPYAVDFDTFYQGLSCDYHHVLEAYGYGQRRVCLHKTALKGRNNKRILVFETQMKNSRPEGNMSRRRFMARLATGFKMALAGQLLPRTVLAAAQPEASALHYRPLNGNNLREMARRKMHHGERNLFESHGHCKG